tara:strand:- start:538 stop:786 length:249 start_codon:yes stop_codon:yes gene_type:complete
MLIKKINFYNVLWILKKIYFVYLFCRAMIFAQVLVLACFYQASLFLKIFTNSLTQDEKLIFFLLGSTLSTIFFLMRTSKKPI